MRFTLLALVAILTFGTAASGATENPSGTEANSSVAAQPSLVAATQPTISLEELFGSPTPMRLETCSFYPPLCNTQTERDCWCHCWMNCGQVGCLPACLEECCS